MLNLLIESQMNINICKLRYLDSGFTSPHEITLPLNYLGLCKSECIINQWALHTLDIRITNTLHIYIRTLEVDSLIIIYILLIYFSIIH